jgi:hypothetical protein
MTILIFEGLGRRFHPGVRAELFRQQTQLGQIFVDKHSAF